MVISIGSAIIGVVTMLIVTGVFTVRGIASRKTNRAVTAGAADFATALVPLLGAIGTLYTAFVTPKVADLTKSRDAAVASADTARKEVKAVRDTVAGMLHFELRTWKHLPAAVMATGKQGTVLDDRAATAAKGDCGPVAVASFQASGPATVQCDSGTFRVRLTRPTRIFLVPSGP